MNHRLLVAATLPPWPALDGLALRLAAMLEVLAEHWEVTLVAPRLPESRAPVGISWRAWEPAIPGESWGFYPWAFDAAPLRTALATACTELAPSVGLAFFGSEHCWPTDGPPFVHDRVDSSTLTAWRYAGLPEGLRRRTSRLRDLIEFARYEARLMQRLQTITVVGDDDARWLRRLGTRCDVQVIPNGVASPRRPGSPPPASDPLAIFTGNMAYQPNVDAVVRFARNVWPGVRARVPRAAFLIAGRHPSTAVRELDRLDGISVCGAVDDMSVTIARATVAVAPMRCGAGVKNKVLEAWAVGVPVVMSSIACNGLSLPPGGDQLVHDEDAAFGACLASLLQDGARSARLGSEAREHVRQHFTWREMAGRMSGLLERAAAGEAAREGHTGISASVPVWAAGRPMWSAFPSRRAASRAGARG